VPIWIVISVATVAGLGIALVVLGWRGRRVDDHPVCRRCRFDLFGAPADQRACPECGGDVTAPRAKRIGNRERRRRTLYAGLATCVLGFGALGTIGVLAAKRTDWNQYKPVAWLKRDLLDTSAGGSASTGALRELSRRIRDNAITAAQIDDVADAVLARQADLKQPWTRVMGEYIESARLAQRLSDQRWKRYATTALEQAAASGVLKVRPKLTREMPHQLGPALLPAQFTIAPPRVGMRLSLQLSMHAEAIAGDMVGQMQSLSRYEGPLMTTGKPFDMPVTLALNPLKLADAPLGQKQLHLRLYLEVRDWQSGSFARFGDTSRPPLAQASCDARATYELLERGTRTVELVSDETLREALLSALTVSQVNLGPQGSCSGLIRCAGGLPIPLACDVILRDPAGKEYRASMLTLTPARPLAAFGTADRLPTGLDRIDVILRSNPNAAKTTVDIDRIWDGELVIADVPVRRLPPATSSSRRSR
jgi:hypothetical protein